MLPADIARAAAVAVGDAVAAGELHVPGGPWYVLPTSGGEPGCYATPLPLRLARAAGRPAAEIAAILAAKLRKKPWAADVTGVGYLRITVTAETLAGLATRIPAAGPACARSDALAHREVSVPGPSTWQAAATWAQAYALTSAAVTGRCAAAAGARVTQHAPEAYVSTRSGSGSVNSAPQGGELGKYSRPSRGVATPEPGSPAELIAFAGPDAVRYGLCRAGSARSVPGAVRAAVRNNLGNPGYAVRYAHAHAAATLRQAAALGLADGDGHGVADGCLARLLGVPAQLALLDALSLLPERVASAARRAQPAVAARYLEDLAAAYYAAHETCPALSYAGGPCDQAAVRARLRLTLAAKTVLATGLDLLGVTAPELL